MPCKADMLQREQPEGLQLGRELFQTATQGWDEACQRRKSLSLTTIKYFKHLLQARLLSLFITSASISLPNRQGCCPWLLHLSAVLLIVQHTTITAQPGRVRNVFGTAYWQGFIHTPSPRCLKKMCSRSSTHKLHVESFIYIYLYAFYSSLMAASS